MSSTQQVSLNNQNSLLNNSRDPMQKVGYCPVTSLALGMILIIGSMLITLAAHQILPHGVNAISDLGLMGRLIGYVGIGVGTIFSLVGSVKWFLSSRSTNDPTKNEFQMSVPKLVKLTLDDLFEGVGGTDSIPHFPTIFIGSFPSLQDMEQPIMKGWVRTKDSEMEQQPFIAIKMRCLNSAEDIFEKIPIRQISDVEESAVRVLILFQYHLDDPLVWNQVHKNEREIYPAFFSWNFTSAKDGTGPTESQLNNYPKLKSCIKEGSGVDINGLKWEIIQ